MPRTGEPPTNSGLKRIASHKLGSNQPYGRYLSSKLALHKVPVGTALGSIQYEVDSDFVRRHRLATHQSSYPSRDRLELAPVSLLAADGLRLAESNYDVSGLVHTGQLLEIVEPPVVGSRVTVSGKLIDRIEKRGRQYLTIETISRDDRGRPLARGRTVVTRYEAKA